MTLKQRLLIANVLGDSTMTREYEPYVEEGRIIMALKYKRRLYTGSLYEGEVQGYFVSAKVFSEPSSYGISEGRISILTVNPNHPNQKRDNNHILAYYDRGWHGKPPEDSAIRAVIEAAVSQFDNIAIDWRYEVLR